MTDSGRLVLREALFRGRFGIQMAAPHSDAAPVSLARLAFQGGSYDGLSLGGLPHSFGVLKKNDGSRFVGQWAAGDFILGQATRQGDMKCTGQVQARCYLCICFSLVNTSSRFSSMKITNFTAWDPLSIFSDRLRTESIKKTFSRQGAATATHV